MPTRYEDFDLRIASKPGGYVAQVTRSPIGPSDEAALQWPFEASQREVRLQLEIAILKGRLRGSRGPMSGEEKILRDFGSNMFRAVFKEPDPIARALSGSLEYVDAKRDRVEGLRVKLDVQPPELALLPWEYVFDENSRDPSRSYLSLSARSPLVRFLDLSFSDYQPIDGPLNVLGMIANPGGEDWELLDADAERRGIEQALDAMPDHVKPLVNFRWVHGETVDHLLDAIQRDDWHVFHFIGHGATEEVRTPQGSVQTEGYVVFADGQGGWTKVYPDDLARYLQTGGHVRLAVLNCCDSGRGASPGEALVKSGVPAAVAMQFPVSNDAAVRFSSRFYNALVTGQSVERALTVGRLSMQQTNRLEWGIPVLFTRAGSNVFFDVQREATPPMAEAAPAAPPRPDPAAEAAARRHSAQEELRRLLGGQ